VGEKIVRPKVTKGTTYKVHTGCGNIYVTPSWSEDYLIEVFATLGKAGACAHAQLEAITRSISLGLKYGVPVEEYIRELRGIMCPNPSFDIGGRVLSCPDVIAKVLALEVDFELKLSSKDVEEVATTRTSSTGQCPECSSMLIFQEGCVLCPSCGYTKC